jgi:hypothetical protein
MTGSCNLQCAWPGLALRVGEGEFSVFPGAELNGDAAKLICYGPIATNREYLLNLRLVGCCVYKCMEFYDVSVPFFQQTCFNDNVFSKKSFCVYSC